MKKLVQLLVILLQVLACSNSSAQRQAKINDSLIKELNSPRYKEKDDMDKAALLFGLASGMGRTFNYDEAIKYGEQYLELAKQLNMMLQVKGYHLLGIFFAQKSDFPKALENLFEALKLYESTKDKEGIERITGAIGNIYQDKGDFAKALDYHLKALKIAEELGDKDAISRNCNNIGNSYGLSGNHVKELEYYFRAMKTDEELGDTSAVAMCLVNIGTAYEEQSKHDSALEYFSRALKVARQSGNMYALSKALANTGSTYLSLVSHTNGKVKMLNRQELLSNAHVYVDSAIALNTGSGDLHGLIECNLNLYRIDSMQGNFRAALDAHLDYMKYRDSVYNTDNNIKISNLETRRLLELKDKQIEIDRLAVAKKRNERVFYIAGIAFLLVIISIVVRSLVLQKRSNVMVTKEKKRSEDLLLNILPSEVAEELKEKGVADAKHFDNVTVLFTDFVNFTKAGERMSPKELVDELHSCFKAFDGILGKYNIEKIKTVGDAYLAVSGLPASNPAHAEDIVAAAIEIRDFMLERKKQLGDRTFGMRTGIHSGSVVAGIVGVKKFAYDIWGDTVNTAARMEQNSEEGKVNISETTFELVKDKFNCRYRGEIAAKNKGQLKMYFVDQGS